MRFSSAFKVGLLTIVALSILLFTVMWIKGRSLSGGDRYTIHFKDVNGIRTGSGVQMMGLRIGQIEDIVPVIKDEQSYVEIKFVITEPNIKIPVASTISIQQSGIIGEQFLEISPPKVRTIHIPILDKSKIIKPQDKVQMKLSSKYYDIGFIKSIEVVETNTLPLPLQSKFKSDYAYKINYVINMPGLIVPERMLGKLVKDGSGMKMRLSPFSNINIPYPDTDLKYTVIEPMRLVDFMELQYKSAASLTETNERISAILTDDVINDLKSTAENLNMLTLKTGKTIDKAELLIDASRKDLDYVMSSVNQISSKIMVLTDNLNEIVGDKDFKTTVANSAQSVGRLSDNLSKLLEDDSMETTIANLNTTLKNISEISSYVNDATKDDKLKADIKKTVDKLNCALDELAITLDTVNELTTEEKGKIKTTLNDAAQTSKNLKKFSEKLNKRFLLFRLIF